MDSSPLERFALRDILPDGKYVSTFRVIEFRWKWFDKLFGRGDNPPYESKVFASRNDMREDHCFETRHYHTEEEARLGHQELCHKWSRTAGRG